MTIVYLHGFNSDGNSWKATALARHFPQARILSPDLPARPLATVALLEQLVDGGCLVIPIGGRIDQDLYQIRRSGRSFEERFITRCRFVPLIEDADDPGE